MKTLLLTRAVTSCLLATAALLGLPSTTASAAEAVAGPQARGLEVNADSGVAPGSQLRLALEATPGGQASARIPGADGVVPLKEVSPGKYTGQYTVRRSDRIDPAAVIRVTLTAEGRTVTGNFTFPPSFMAAVTDTRPAPVTTVVLGAPSAALPSPPPLAVMSHQNNGAIGRDGTVIRGRTAPFATVFVRVDAVAPLTRRADANVALRMLSEAVQADANGEFSIDFNPRYVRDNASLLPVPGTRYDISISSSRDNATTESRLTLFQRG